MIEIPKLSKPAGEDKAPRWFHVAVALSMLLSAGAALVSALKTSATMQALVEQNARLVKAGSTPILQHYSGNVSKEGERVLRIWVENVGTGPARVVWFDLRFQGKPMADIRELPRMAAAAASQPLADDAGLPFVRSTIAGHVLAAGHERRVFEARWKDMKDPASQSAYEQVDQHLRSVSAEACYCSVFDECWQTDFGPTLPKPVASCERARPGKG